MSGKRSDSNEASVRSLELRDFKLSARNATLASGLTNAVFWAILVSGALLCMVPLYVMVVLALKTPQETQDTSMWVWPVHGSLDNFRAVLTDPELNFLRKSLNTLFLSTVPTLGVVLTSAMVAYPFARRRFIGRDRLFLLLLSTMMLPFVVTMIPNYVIFAKLGWINSYKPFVIPAFFGGGAFNIFLVRQFLLSIPSEMDEAARIDGASNATIFWRILMPNCGPVLATIGVFSFVGGFKDFLGPLMYLNDPEKMNLEVGLRTLQNAHKTEWHLMMAGAVVVMVPILVIFVLCQRYFVKGIVLTGGK